jgi:hypothetical protein
MRPLSAPSLLSQTLLAGSLLVGQMACRHQEPHHSHETAAVAATLEAGRAQTKGAAEKAGQVGGAEPGGEKDKEKGEIATRVTAAIEAAKIQNPTNRELISKLFTFLLGSGKDSYADHTKEFPYIAFKQAFGTYEGGDELSIGVTANHYASTMNVESIATDALAVFGKMTLEDKMRLARSASGVIPQIKDGAALYLKYGKLFDDGSFERCPGDVDFNKDVRNEKHGITDEVKEDPACEEGTLVANYHGEEEFSKLVMRLMHRLHVPADVVTTTASKTMRTILGK